MRTPPLLYLLAIAHGARVAREKPKMRDAPVHGARTQPKGYWRAVASELRNYCTCRSDESRVAPADAGAVGLNTELFVPGTCRVDKDALRAHAASPAKLTIVVMASFSPRGYATDESRRRRGGDADVPRRRSRGGAAAGTRIFRGDESRRRRGGDADISRRRVAATPRLENADIFRGDESRPARPALSAAICTVTISSSRDRRAPQVPPGPVAATRSTGVRLRQGAAGGKGAAALERTRGRGPQRDVRGRLARDAARIPLGDDAALHPRRAGDGRGGGRRVGSRRGEAEHAAEPVPPREARPDEVGRAPGRRRFSPRRRPGGDRPSRCVPPDPSRCVPDRRDAYPTFATTRAPSHEGPFTAQGSGNLRAPPSRKRGGSPRRRRRSTRSRGRGSRRPGRSWGRIRSATSASTRRRASSSTGGRAEILPVGPGVAISLSRGCHQHSRRCKN